METLPFKYRWSPTLGSFEEDPGKVWGIEEYIPGKHQLNPVVFCGLYSLRDFYALWNHHGEKYVWFTGSDIPRLRDGYWLNGDGSLRVSPETLWAWIRENCECWCENDVEAEELLRMGIPAFVGPSFLGDPSKFPVTYKSSGRPAVYASVSGDDFELYQWPMICRVARDCFGVDFHLYGNTKPFPCVLHNVTVHGRVSSEQMNEETSKMQAGLRPLPFDGCSEVIVKSVLRGQWTISKIPYPWTWSYYNEAELIRQLNNLVYQEEPNLAGRELLLKSLNKYPWVS